MAKTLREILNGVKKETVKDINLDGFEELLGAGEKKFVKKHTVAKHDDRVGNGDDVYNASKVKVSPYKKQSNSVYEDVKKKLTEGSAKFSKNNFFVHKEDGKIHSVHKEIDMAKSAANKAEVKSGKTHHISKTSEVEGNPGVHQVHTRYFPDWSKIEKGQKSKWSQVKAGEQDLQYHRLNENDDKKRGPFHVVKLDPKGNPIKGSVVSFSSPEAAKAYAKANKGRLVRKNTITEISDDMIKRYVNKKNDRKHPEVQKAITKLTKKKFSTVRDANEEIIIEDTWKYLQYPSREEAVIARNHHFSHKDKVVMKDDCRHIGGGKIAFKGEFHGPKPTRLMRHEEVINELSPGLLGRYAKKAKNDALKHAHSAGHYHSVADQHKSSHIVRHYDTHKDVEKHASKHLAHAEKRMRGMNRAVNKLVDKATSKETPKKSEPKKIAIKGPLVVKTKQHKVEGKPHFKMKKVSEDLSHIDKEVNELSSTTKLNYIKKAKIDLKNKRTTGSFRDKLNNIPKIVSRSDYVDHARKSLKKEDAVSTSDQEDIK